MSLRSSQESTKASSSGHPPSISSPPSQNSSMNPIIDASNMKEMSDRLLETFLSNCR